MEGLGGEGVIIAAPREALAGAVTGDAGVAKQLTVVARRERVNLPQPPRRPSGFVERCETDEDNANEIFFSSSQERPPCCSL